MKSIENNWFLYFLLIVFIIVGFSGNNKHNNEIKELYRINDSIALLKEKQITERDTIINNALKVNDSLINLSNKIKYIKYEKFIYLNRDINGALDVFSNHPVNTGAKKED